jgi:hypothetical protein
MSSTSPSQVSLRTPKISPKVSTSESPVGTPPIAAGGGLRRTLCGGASPGDGSGDGGADESRRPGDSGPETLPLPFACSCSAGTGGAPDEPDGASEYVLISARSSERSLRSLSVTCRAIGENADERGRAEERSERRWVWYFACAAMVRASEGR